MRLDRSALRAAAVQRQTFVATDVALADGRRVDLQLEPFRLFADDMQLTLGRRDADDIPFAYDPARMTLLRGHVVDQPHSDVFLAVSSDLVTGFIQPGQGETRQFFSHRTDGDQPLGADEVSIFIPEPNAGFVPPVPFCGTDIPLDLPLMPEQPAAATALPRVMRTLELAIDSDYEFFELFGNTQATMDYVTALYGAISHIYMRDVQIRIELVFVRLWDTPQDLFNEPNPLSPFSAHWLNQMFNVQRDTVSLLTGRRNLPYGGVAFINGLCNSASFSVSGYLLGSFPDPSTPSMGHWDIIVCAHELGHNCGTRHTHDGYTPLIDNCASGDIRRGTIMSYCHIQPGGTSNVDLRFHSRVKQVIRGFTSSTTCIIEDCNMNSLRDNNDIFFGVSPDTNNNGIPDECEDCNENGILDSVDIADGMADLNGNGQPDICDPDCNGNAIPDSFDLSGNDTNGNDIPDECDPDCNLNGTPDHVELLADMSLDVDRNDILDQCQDCDGDGVTDIDALAGAHNIWLANDSLDYIAEYHALTGVEIKQSESGFIQQATDLIISDDGRILVADAAQDTVLEFNGDGQYVGEFVTSGAGNLDRPTALAFARDGRLLVAARSPKIAAFDGETGAFIESLVDTSPLLDEPGGLAIDSEGNIVVSSVTTHFVLRYDSQTGAFLGHVVNPVGTTPFRPHGLAFQADGHLLVAASGFDAVYEYDAAGQFMRVFTRSGNPNGFWELRTPWSVRIGPDRNVYVSSLEANVPLQMFDGALGVFLRSYYVLNQTELFEARATGFDFMPGDDTDCNRNNIPDTCDIAANTVADANSDGIPDECQRDCNDNGRADQLDLIPFGFSLDCNLNGSPDECDVSNGTSNDCDDNGIPDECDPDCNNNGLADVCEPDCNGNGIADECDITAGTVFDINNDGRPDECPNPIDVDDDGDVDLAEYSSLTDCYTGDISFPTYTSPADTCIPVDFDDDEDVDLIDYGQFQAAFTGPCALTVTTSPAETTTCSLDEVTLTVTAEGDDVGYQWRRDGVPILGATSQELYFFEIMGSESGSYDVLVFNDCNITVSDAADVTVLPRPVIDAGPADGMYCRGDSAQLSVSADGARPLTYQWQFRIDSSSDPMDLPDATNATLTVENIADSDVGQYRCVVTDGNGCQRRSAYANLELFPDVFFASQPTGGELCIGSQLILFVSATQSPSFQWHKDGEAISGADAFFLLIPNVTSDDSGVYQVEANGECGPVMSAPAMIDVVDCSGE